MTKVETWTGQTQTHGFSGDVFHDSVARKFKIEVVVITPADFPEYRGDKPQTPSTVETVTITASDIDTLRERVKEHIRSRYGEIKVFHKK